MKRIVLFQIAVIVFGFQFAKAQSPPRNPIRTGPPSTVFPKTPQLQEAVYAGTGCPAGTVSVSLAPDNSAISILFDQFAVSTEGAHQVSDKECTLVVPVPVARGMNAKVVKVDYRGYRYLPKRSRLDIAAQHALSDWASGNFLSNLHTYQSAQGGLKDGEFMFSATAVNSPSDIVPCGKSFNLHVKSRLILDSQAATEGALATLDSADAQTKGSVTYHLSWKQCGPRD